jgi:hypothetical protein
VVERVSLSLARARARRQPEKYTCSSSMVLLANVVDSLITNHEGAVRVLKCHMVGAGSCKQRKWWQGMACEWVVVE